MFHQFLFVFPISWYGSGLELDDHKVVSNPSYFMILCLLTLILGLMAVQMHKDDLCQEPCSQGVRDALIGSGQRVSMSFYLNPS